MPRWLVLALLVACDGGDTDTDSILDTDVADTDTDTDTDPCAPYTWSTVGEPFVRSWCSGCHGGALSGDLRAGAPDGVDFDTYDDVSIWLGRIQIRALDQGDMPPGGGPSPQDLDDLDAWLACGAPE